MARLGAWLTGLAGREVGRRELLLLCGAIALGLLVRAGFVIATQDAHVLAGDEPEYDSEARFILDGRPFWTELPYGVAHAGAWKAPGYPAFLSFMYLLTGSGPNRALLLQTVLLGPLVIFLAWLLAARLFDRATAGAAAAIAALYPNMWQWETRLYPEALALPLALVLLLLVLTRPPAPRRAALAGLVLGASLLVRPTSVFLFAGMAVAWIALAGLRRGAALTGVAAAVAVLCVLPWTVRNHVVLHGFVPISLQDAAAYGTFNDQAANDHRWPFAWRASVARDRDVFSRASGLSDTEFRSKLQARALDYIRAHPASLAKAFFWNGLSRTWDVRRPARSVAEAPFEARKRQVARIALYCWWVLLAGALAALWRLRSRMRPLVLAALAWALAASIVFTAAAATRYRLTIEPLVVVLAASTFVELARRLHERAGRRRRMVRRAG
jgi:4-amino-4-deoxy-L-arabinose transferase-like glycosyltransferase